MKYKCKDASQQGVALWCEGALTLIALPNLCCREGICLCMQTELPEPVHPEVG